MEFVVRLQSAIRKIQTTVYLSPPVLLLPPPERFLRTVNSANPSMTRLQVLRRDRYRCRCCGQRGDEITLEVCGIHPNARAVEEMRTLCHRCRNSADEAAIQVAAVPDLSQHLLRPFRTKPVLLSRTRRRKEKRESCSSAQCAPAEIKAHPHRCLVEFRSSINCIRAATPLSLAHRAASAMEVAGSLRLFGRTIMGSSQLPVVLSRDTGRRVRLRLSDCLLRKAIHSLC